jgi:hypothetical protein
MRQRFRNLYILSIKYVYINHLVLRVLQEFAGEIYAQKQKKIN